MLGVSRGWKLRIGFGNSAEHISNLGPEATLKVESEISANDMVSRLAFAFGDLVTLF